MKRAFPCGFALRSIGGIGLAAIVGLLAAGSVATASNPPAGVEAPRFVLDDLNGTAVDLKMLRGRAVVIVFGELDHEGTRKTCDALLTALTDARLAHGKVIPILVVARDQAPEILREQANEGRFPALILHDPTREAFGAYQILVIPSVVVIDREGVVVHAMPGFSPRFADVINAAMLRATGQMSPEQFEQVLHPELAEPIDRESARASRLTALGDELVRHGLLDLAEERYKEALAIAPGYERAMLGLGRLLIDADRLVEAEAMYRSLLTKHPESAEAQLGIAEVGIRRGGDAMGEAESTLHILLDRDQKQPRALYLLGLVYEKRGQWADAARNYKAAAEMLLRTQ
ncbi:MAG: hypothetical protein D6695_01890 [Planctomycetota bacterium]|nr:MAG: hypothetical protein D6695_01890 [Planctomycetota bacterium]